MKALVEYLIFAGMPLAVMVGGILMGKERRERALYDLAEWTDCQARRLHDRIADELDSLRVAK